MFSAVKRGTLLYPSSPRGDLSEKHLFVILCDPVGPQRQVVMVPVCTARRGCDRTCILQPDDHSFVKLESYVAYSLCRQEPEDKLIRGTQTGLFVDKGLMAVQVFKKVLQGVRKSPFTKPFVLDYL